MLACDACNIPLDISDDEKLIRAVKTPYYFHKTRKSELTHKAYMPPPGQSDVSVTRYIMGADFCAEQSRKTASNSAPEEYAGMLVSNAAKIASTGTTVADYRKDFCGHAHLNHGYVMPGKGQTMDPKEKKDLDDRCKLILKLSRFFPDTHTSGPGWNGPPLTCE